MQLDTDILREKPDAEGDDATPSEATDNIKKKAIPMTPHEVWTKNNIIYLNKIGNAERTMKGVLEEVSTLHEHLLGKELRPR